MAVVMFGGMSRYNDLSRLRWRNLKFHKFGGFVDLIQIERQKNSRFRRGNTVTVSVAPSGEVCPVRLLRDPQGFVGPASGSRELRV